MMDHGVERSGLSTISEVMLMPAPRTPPSTPPKLSEAEQLARQKADIAKKEFYKNRKILIEDVPPVTYEEVKEFMGGYKIANINISRKTRNAYVILKHGEEAEEIVESLRGKKLLDKEVRVSIKPNETLLCLAHLPFHLTDLDLRKFASQFGIIEKCFLMRNERTGESKGYGLVEYTHNRDHTNTARLKIDGMQVHQCRVHCEFVLSHLTAFSDLHSKCLFISKLPGDIVNEQKLEEMCRFYSQPVNVVFSKIGMRNDQHLGFAVIEYATAYEAEMMQARLHGHELGNNRSLSATFCIPGMPGLELYNKALNAVGSGRSAGSDVKALGLISMPNMPPPFTNMNANMNQGLRMGMRPPPPPQVAQGIRNLFQQLQVMQQNMNQLMQGGPRPPPSQPPQPQLGMGFLGPRPNMLPPGNPMMQQAIALLVASLQSQQQQQQLMMGLHGLQSMLQQQTNMGPNLPTQQMLQGNPIMLQTNNFIQALLTQLQLQQQSPSSAGSQANQQRPQQTMNRPNNQENRPTVRPQQQGFQGPKLMNQNNDTRGPNQFQQGPRQNFPQFQVQNQNAFNNLQQFLMNLQRGNVGGGPMFQQPQQQQQQQQPQQNVPNQNQPRPNLNNIPQNMNQGQALVQNILSNVMNTIMNLSKQGGNPELLKGMDQRPNLGPIGQGRRPGTVEQNYQQSSGNNHNNSNMNDTYRNNNPDRGAKRPIQSQGSYTYQGNRDVDQSERPEKVLRRSEDVTPVTAGKEVCNETRNTQTDNFSRGYVFSAEGTSSQEKQTAVQFSGNQTPCSPGGAEWKYNPSQFAYSEYNTMNPFTPQGITSTSPSQGQGSSDGAEWVNPLAQPPNQQVAVTSPTSVEPGHGLDAIQGTASQVQSRQEQPGVLQVVQQMMAQAQTLSTPGGQEYPNPSTITTPVNPLKRPSTCLVPKPEPSPEGEYIGQHSQGLGGHYSTSYIKRKKLL